MEQFVFLDSVSFLPCVFRNLPETFSRTLSKSWYYHYFNTQENLKYLSPNPEISYYGLNEMSE